jgi:hypothetical protein
VRLDRLEIAGVTMRSSANVFRCLQCDRTIRAAARACPHCGAPTPGGRARRGNIRAFLFGVPLAAGFFWGGSYVNGNGARWLTAMHPIDKIACGSARAEDAATTAFNGGPAQILDFHEVKIVGLADPTQTFRSADSLGCIAIGDFDDHRQRPVTYRFALDEQEVSLKVDVR